VSAQVVVLADYQGQSVSFTADGWFNATEAAKRFGKKPAEWIRSPETKRYLRALARKNEVEKSHFIRTERGRAGNRGGGATWLHPKLAVRFAQWLDVDFAVWCDEQIDALLHGRQTVNIGLYAQRIAFEGRKAGSEQKGRIGSRLMNERRREKPALVREDQGWKLTMEPGLFPALERQAA
jgi:hypothetical protein